MASRDSPKKEDQGKDVQKQGALDAHVTELCTSLQETMAQGEMSGQESSVTGTPPTRHRTVPSRSAPTDGIRHRESYCLLVQVIKDALRLSERDVRVLTHAWDENIAADICESQIGCLPGTYKLREYHQDRFQPRELSSIEKECFFAGLHDQSKYLVSHMKDKKEYGPVDMLKELRENDEARYPANTAH